MLAAQGTLILQNQLVLEYKGSLSGEHNDGLIRGPWLEEQFGREIVGLFRETKDIFDPENIFNPHKKSRRRLGLQLLAYPTVVLACYNKIKHVGDTHANFWRDL